MLTKLVLFVSEPYVPVYMTSNECYLKKLPHMTEPSENESTHQIPEFLASRTDLALVDQPFSQVGSKPSNDFCRNIQSWQCWHFCIAYIGKSNIVSVKKVSPVGIEPGTSYDPFRCLPD